MTESYENPRRDVEIPCRDVTERVQISVATLKRRDVESQRRDVESQRRDVTEKAPKNFHTYSNLVLQETLHL